MKLISTIALTLLPLITPNPLVDTHTKTRVPTTTVVNSLTSEDTQPYCPTVTDTVYPACPKPPGRPCIEPQCVLLVSTTLSCAAASCPTTTPTLTTTATCETTCRQGCATEYATVTPACTVCGVGIQAACPKAFG